MHGDLQPVEFFVAQSFQNPRVINIVGNWRVESEKLQQIALTYFKEMGIYFVEAGQKPVLLDTLLKCLRHSPEVKALVKRAESEESERKRTRHADI